MEPIQYFYMLSMYSPLAACIAVFVCFPFYRDKTVTILRELIVYIIGVSGFGLMGAAVGYSVGVSIFCYGENAGSQCGLGGIFVSAPLGLSLGVVIFLVLRAKHHGAPASSIVSDDRSQA